MDVSQLWSAVQEIQQHVSTMNLELGKTMTDVMWLKASFWEFMNWMRIIGCGIVVGILLSVWNLVVTHKNGHKKNGK